MQHKRTYRVFSDKGDLIATFIGDEALMLNSLSHGRLSQTTGNEAMLIINDAGGVVNVRSLGQDINIYMYKGWKLVQKSY